MKIEVISFTQAGFSLSQRLKNLLSADTNVSQNQNSEDFQVNISFGGKVSEEKIKKSEVLGAEDSTKEDFSLAGGALYDFSLAKRAISLNQWTKDAFQKGNAMIFIGAAGIAVRSIAPFIKNKAEDPAVLVIDEKAGFVIPLLSGHLGGANALAKKIACLLGSTPVITTASDVNSLFAVDDFARENSLSINNLSLAKDFASNFLKEKHGNFSVTPFIQEGDDKELLLVPRCFIIGIGCKKGKSCEEITDFIYRILGQHKINPSAIEKIVSIDLKKDEKGIIETAKKMGVPFKTYSAAELNQVSQKVTSSSFVEKTTGTDNVCERAVLASGGEKILIAKIAENGMTFALGVKRVYLEI